MSETSRRTAETEISALAKLKASNIDTSVLPEVRGWSQAARGRFCRAVNQRVVVLLGENDRLTTPNTLNVVNSKTDVGHLIKKMLDRDAAAWGEFVRRFHKVITATVVRTVRRWGSPSATIVDDLVNDTYLKLSEAQLLKEISRGMLSQDNQIFGFLKVIAANVVVDHFRAYYAHERGGKSLQHTNIQPAEPENVRSPEIETHILLDQIDHFLQGHTSHRDRQIFMLYYRAGLTAKEISRFPEINLTTKGVESVLWRLTRLLRSRLAAGDKGLAPALTATGAALKLRRS